MCLKIKGITSQLQMIYQDLSNKIAIYNDFEFLEILTNIIIFLKVFKNKFF